MTKVVVEHELLKAVLSGYDNLIKAQEALGMAINALNISRMAYIPHPRGGITAALESIHEPTSISLYASASQHSAGQYVPDGSENKPFGSLRAALSFIASKKLFNTPITIYLDNAFTGAYTITLPDGFTENFSHIAFTSYTSVGAVIPKFRRSLLRPPEMFINCKWEFDNTVFLVGEKDGTAAPIRIGANAHIVVGKNIGYDYKGVIGDVVPPVYVKGGVFETADHEFTPPLVQNESGLVTPVSDADKAPLVWFTKGWPCGETVVAFINGLYAHKVPNDESRPMAYLQRKLVEELFSPSRTPTEEEWTRNRPDLSLMDNYGEPCMLSDVVDVFLNNVLSHRPFLQ
jgi:hypothetical protein